MNARRSDTILISALLLVSLLIRVPYLLTERLWPDEALYALIACNFIANPATVLRLDAFAEHLPIVPVLTLVINLLGILATFRRARGSPGPLLACAPRCSWR